MSAAIVTAPSRPGVSIDSLARELSRLDARIIGDGEVRVTDVRQDSRRVEPGDLFVARAGERTDGARFANDAVARGAVALLVAHGAPVGGASVPRIEVSDVRVALALAAEAVHGFPSRAVEVIGITGTNGKTTVAWLLEQVLTALGKRPGRLGTLGFSFGSSKDPSSLTTPEADGVSRAVAAVRAGGGSHLVMEVSSHALSLARVDGLRFGVAAFTNLSQDHLDFHGTEEAYAAAKARLFEQLAPRTAVLNVDDAFGASLANRVAGRVVRVSRAAPAELAIEAAEVDARGIRARVRTPRATVNVVTPLLGAHNLENVLVVLGIIEALQLDIEGAASALESATPVPGRLERCDVPADDVVVLVDYAHTPDALARTLDACRAFTRERLVCVFGCGGDRDAAKRPLMGAAVGARADHAIVTNDNPRSESPQAIADQILPGLSGASYEVCLDRAEAIERAVLGAGAGDVVLLAGKGHEPYQLVGDQRFDFDDRKQARRALSLRRQRQGV